MESLLAHDVEAGSTLANALAQAAEDANQPLLAAGSLRGQYKILEHLGSGGMGDVYKATDSKLGRQVALKLLRPEVVKKSGGLARFEREARTLASLNNAHIALIYDFEEHGGMPFLVLEYVPGPTLADRLRRGPLPVPEAVAAARQIAEGLEAAHARGIMHRDLKPPNIKLGEDGQVKVLDFGLAKPVGRPRTATATDPTLAITEKLTQEW